MPNWAMTSVTIKGSKVTEKEFREKLLMKNSTMIKTDELYGVSPETYLDFDGTNMFAAVKQGRETPKKLFAVTKDDPFNIISADAMFTISESEWATERGKLKHRRTIETIGRGLWDRLLTKELDKMDLAKIVDRFKAKHGDVSFLEWYDWNCDNLGTKWKFELLGLEFDGDEISFCTETAWSPPEGWLKKLAEFTGGKITGSYEIEGYGHHSHYGDSECTNNDEGDWDCQECDWVQDEHEFEIKKGGEVWTSAD